MEITKNIIRGTTAVAIGLSAWACEKGYVVPDTVQSKTPITELTPLPVEEVYNEKTSRYGQFEIGESKIGTIYDLRIQTNPDLNVVNKVKDLALKSIPEANGKDISVNIYDMVGDKGIAPFITASINDSNGNLEFAYVGFSLDENKIQRPPVDGDIDIFYPLRVVEQEDKSNFIGIPDVTTQSLQTPIMFYIDQQNNTYFYPPYTDYIAQNDTTYGGMKVQAMLLKPEIIAPTEADLLIKDRIQFAKLDYLLSEQYLKDLIKQDLNGKLPKFTEESFSIRPGTIIRHYKNKENNLTYLNNGFDTIFSISDAKKFIPKNRKAWIIADIKETSINNTQIFLIVYKWKNYDNSIGYTANIAMPDKNMSNQEQLRFESGYNNSLVIPSGAFFENTKSCIKWLSYYKGNANDVCSLFFKNDQMTLPEYIYDNWAETGILKNEVLDNLGNKKLVLPISPSWLQSTSN